MFSTELYYDNVLEACEKLDTGGKSILGKSCIISGKEYLISICVYRDSYKYIIVCSISGDFLYTLTIDNEGVTVLGSMYPVVETYYDKNRVRILYRDDDFELIEEKIS